MERYISAKHAIAQHREEMADCRENFADCAERNNVATPYRLMVGEYVYRLDITKTASPSVKRLKKSEAGNA